MRNAKKTILCAAVLATAAVAHAAAPYSRAGTTLPPPGPGHDLRGDGVFAATLTAAPGEHASCWVAAPARPTAGTMHVTVEPFRSDDASMLPRSVVTTHRVLSRGARRDKDDPVVVAPEFLVPFDHHLDVPAGETIVVWLTVAVPLDARPGTYRTSVLVDGAAAAVVSLNVLAFALAPMPIPAVMLYTYEFRYLDRYEPDFVPARKRRSRADRAGFVAKGRRVVRDLAAHGMNTIFPHCGPSVITRDGKPFIPDLYQSLDEARARGMTMSPGWFVGWLVNAQWKDLPKFDAKRDAATLVTVAREAARAARERGFPDIILVPSDEPNHEKKLPVARELLKRAGRIDGVRWAVTGNYPALEALSGLYDIAIIAGGTQEQWAALKKAGAELWIYENNATTGRDATWSRFVYGLFAWRAAFDGVGSWTYPPNVEDYRGARTDARDGSKIPCFTKEGRPVTTLVWEAIREGITDRRYIETLRLRIEEAKRRGRAPEARRAQAVLDDLRKRVDPDLKSHRWKHTEYGGPHPRGFEWEDLERARRDVRTAILRLKR